MQMERINYVGLKSDFIVLVICLPSIPISLIIPFIWSFMT